MQEVCTQYPHIGGQGLRDWALLPTTGTACDEDTHLLLVTLTEMVAAVQETVPAHDPLLLDEALEARAGSTVGVHHHLHQGGNEAAEVRSVLLWEGPGSSAKRKEDMKC